MSLWFACNTWCCINSFSLIDWWIFVTEIARTIYCRCLSVDSLCNLHSWCVFCGKASRTSERPLKYETMRPVSAVISVKHRPPTVQRNVRSATVRRPQCTDLLTDNKLDITGDHVTGHKLTITPDNSDVEDTGKDVRRVSTQKSKGPAHGDTPEETKKKTEVLEEKNRHRVERWRTRGPQCAGGYEDDMLKTKVMEDNFKQQVIHLQQQLGLTTQGYVLPLWSASIRCFLPRDATHKHGICRHPVSVRHVRELRQNE